MTCPQLLVVHQGRVCGRQPAASARPARAGGSWRRSRGSMSRCVRAVMLQPGTIGSSRVVPAMGLARDALCAVYTRTRCAAGLLILPRDAGVHSVQQPIHAAVPGESAAERRHHGAQRELPAVQQQRRDGAGSRDHQLRPALLGWGFHAPGPAAGCDSCMPCNTVAFSTRMVEQWQTRVQKLPAGSATRHG